MNYLRVAHKLSNQKCWKSMVCTRYFGSSHHNHVHGSSNSNAHDSHSHDNHGHDDHGHGHEPHVPEFYDNLGKVMLVGTFLWIFYRAKENNGNIFVRQYILFKS
jgi:hypothetical protein